MEKIRKGNDISILWEIMRGTEEVPYDLTGKDLTLYIKSMYKTEKVTDFTTDGNVLKWTFLGKNQSHTGVYSLTLVENEGKEDMHTVDECHAFELVNCSSKVGGDAESHVQIDVISLKSAILLSAILPDKELDVDSTNVVENGVIAREFDATNKRIDELKAEHEEDIVNAVQEVLGGASETYDTLKEIEEYIIKDEAGAVELGKQVAQNTKDIQDNPFEKGSGENSAVLKGGNNIASLDYSVALGYKTQATGKKSVAEGDGTTASATVSHAEGKNTTASGYASHSEGEGTTASATVSHAEGYNCIAEGNYSHAEGYCTQAINTTSHAEGDSTKTTGSDSHAEGNTTWAEGWASHAEGLGTIANNTAEHACGKFNVSTLSEDISESTQFSIGIGSSDTDRKNAIEVKQNGGAYIIGIGGFTGANSDSATDLASLLNSSITDIELDNLFNE